MATRKMPPFMGKETPSEEKKEMKIKKLSPAMYRAGEKAEGVHGKSGMMKPSKYARGGKVRYDEGGDVPEGGRFDADTYERARNSVLQKQLDEQFPAGMYKRKAAPATKSAPKAAAPKAAAPSPAPSPAPKKESDMSVNERLAASRAKMRGGSGPTDTRSVNERIKGLFGFAKGGSVGASRRADGVAQRGKTKGRVI